MSPLPLTEPRDAVPPVLDTGVDGHCDKLETDDRHHQFITLTVHLS